MRASPTNPASNDLPSDLAEPDILEAVTESGYPLQTVISDLLRRADFEVQEEWGYVDQDSHESRAIDLVAVKWLDPRAPSRSKIYPKLALIIECKQSRLPYVFFLCSDKLRADNFPLVVGLRKRDLTLKTDDSLSSWEVPILDALSLTSHSFLTEPLCCTSFSKCIKKSDKVELSGSESFYSLVLPVLKAVHHFDKIQSTVETAMHFHCHLTIGLGVLSAPMIGVRVKADGTIEPLLLPWVRVVRHESDERRKLFFREGLFAIDVVHKDFLQKYLTDFVFSFATEFSRLSIKHQKTLAAGKGFARGMEKYHLLNLESRLRT